MEKNNGNIVCQTDKTLNFRQIMDENKIFLAKLAQGAIGQENAYLLGSLLISKLQQTALSRQDSQNRPFWGIYTDEFHHLICPTISTLLSGIRKFRVGLTLLTQQYRQIQSKDADVAASVLANCTTRICFRLGDDDAERFQHGFSFFTAEHLRNLNIGCAIARIERADFDFNLKTRLIPKVERHIAEKRRQAVVRSSRDKYATPRFDAENKLFGNTVRGVETPQSLESASNPPVESNIEAENLKPPNHGRGGRHHQELQTVIKRMAESYGFTAEIEKSVSEGAGFVDVSLEKETLKIACEVSVTSTADYETKNILKCLSAGYDYALVIVSNQKKLPALNAKLLAAIPIALQDRVKTFSLTGLLTFLRQLTQPVTAKKDGEKPAGQRLDLAEASEFLSINVSTLYRWVSEGRIPFYRVGREYRFDRDELVLIGRQDLSGKRKATVKLSPLKVEKNAPKSQKEQDARYRKLLKLD